MYISLWIKGLAVLSRTLSHAGGKLPVKLLELRSNTVNDGNELMPAGILPVNPFLERSSTLREVKLHRSY